MNAILLPSIQQNGKYELHDERKGNYVSKSKLPAGLREKMSDT